jgi:hypothetical protein
MIRRVVTILIASAAVTAGAQRSAACRTPSGTAPWMLVQKQILSEEDGAWKNDSLRKVLLREAKMSSPAVAPQLGWEGPMSADTTPSEVITTLKGLPRGSTWPTKSIVGLAGVRAVFKLAHRDTALARIALHRMMESGLEEAIKPDVAVLEDRVRLTAGRKQLYGTQLVMSDGRLVPAAIEDSAHVDLRREGAFLPPLAWSVCNANAK